MFGLHPIMRHSSPVTRNPTLDRSFKQTRRVHKSAAAFLMAAVIGGGAALFTTSQPASAQEVAAVVQAAYVPRSTDELRQLAMPVALYPDAVLADVLTASTYPQDIADASAYLNAGNDPSTIDEQSWDSSVKAVARYRDVLNYMAGNLEWLNSLGDAFLNQPDDVMNAVQALRAEANSAGNLTSNEQQNVICDGSVIEIVPADPQVIYVPVYDPQVVYISRPGLVGQERFSVGVQVGLWLDRDCDWHDHTVYVGGWGADRPWWHRDFDHVGVGVNAYASDRPGDSRDAHVTKVMNVTRINNIANMQVTRWQHDSRKPVPQVVTRGLVRSTVRPELTGTVRSTGTPSHTVNAIASRLVTPQPIAVKRVEPTRSVQATPRPVTVKRTAAVRPEPVHAVAAVRPTAHPAVHTEVVHTQPQTAVRAISRPPTKVATPDNVAGHANLARR